MKIKSEQIWEKSHLLWVIDNKIKNEKGHPLEFNNHRFLKDIYGDFSQIQVVRKASQVGFTVMKILKAFYLAKFRNYSLIYTLPTFSLAQEFGSAKVNALISNNRVLADLVEKKDSILQKQIGTNFIHFRGASPDTSQERKSEAGVGIVLSADCLIADECDRSDQDILVQYESRLAASDFKGRWYFSNPTHPNTLSQQIYAQSDQKHWFVKCGNGHWQYLDYWKNVKEGRFVCDKCGKEITNEERINGEWIKKYQNRDISGYWLSHLMMPWIAAKEIETAYETKDRAYFYNFVLGLPYIGSDVVINRDMVLRNIDLKEPNFQKNNALGVDVGLKKHWVLGNRQGIFRVGETDKWEDIEKLIKMYDVEIAVFDALPDLTEPRKLREKYPGIVWLHYFKKDVRKADFILWDNKTHTVYSDRTKIIQQVQDEFNDRKIRFQMKPEELGSYISHWQTLYKTTEKDRMGIERDVWQSSGQDHYAMATVYFRLALEKSGQAHLKEWSKNKIMDYNEAPDIKEVLNKTEV